MILPRFLTTNIPNLPSTLPVNQGCIALKNVSTRLERVNEWSFLADPVLSIPGIVFSVNFNDADTDIKVSRTRSGANTRWIRSNLSWVLIHHSICISPLQYPSSLLVLKWNVWIFQVYMRLKQNNMWGVGHFQWGIRGWSENSEISEIFASPQNSPPRF